MLDKNHTQPLIAAPLIFLCVCAKMVYSFLPGLTPNVVFSSYPCTRVSSLCTPFLDSRWCGNDGGRLVCVSPIYQPFA
jgi:hypothetical protein